MNPDKSIRHDEQTKRLLKDSFLKLYACLPFEKISVKILTNEAKFSRGTFYLYYNNVREMLTEIEDELIDNLKIIENVRKKISASGKELSESDVSELVSRIPFRLGDLKRQLKIILQGNQNRSFIEKFHKFHNKIIVNAFKTNNLCNSNKAEYLTEYITAAHIGMVQYWVKNDDAENPAEIIAFINKLTENCVKNI
jgi:AcrR family transcriptional regulator